MFVIASYNYNLFTKNFLVLKSWSYKLPGFRPTKKIRTGMFSNRLAVWRKQEKYSV